MAINQPGIAINIKAFLPTGKTLDEQFNALTIVKTAHETGDYSALLAASQDVEVKTESKTRRIEEKPEPQAATTPEPTECQDAPIGLTEMPETAPEGEPSLQDVADYGVDDGAGMAAPVKQDNQPEPWATPAAKPAGRKSAGVGDL